MKDIKKNQKTNEPKLKVKLIKEKPRKVYAASIEYDYHLEELAQFVNDLKDKKFDIIINGKLFNITSAVAKSKFIEGFRAAYNILFKHVLEASRTFKDTENKLSAENYKLKNEATQVNKDKELYHAKEMAMTVRVAAWQDRIVELEDTCQTLRSVIDEMGKNVKSL